MPRHGHGSRARSARILVAANSLQFSVTAADSTTYTRQVVVLVAT